MPLVSLIWFPLWPFAHPCYTPYVHGWLGSHVYQSDCASLSPRGGLEVVFRRAWSVVKPTTRVDLRQGQTRGAGRLLLYTVEKGILSRYEGEVHMFVS